MDFCNICDNMLYIKYDNEELQNYCTIFLYSVSSSKYLPSAIASIVTAK